MATFHHNHNHRQLPPPPPRKVCFSFAAYAKTVIAALKSSDVYVSAGLTDSEITAVETAGVFKFPPDLRSILSEGLPVGPFFPNWRSSSPHQLRLLTSLPILSLSKEVSGNNFWVPTWGPRPKDNDEAHLLAQKFLAQAPPLVPVFRHCYIPAEPNMAGNPVFYVHGADVRLLSAHVGGFFIESEFQWNNCVWRRSRRLTNNVNSAPYPAWAEEARRVEFWTDAVARDITCTRWWGGELSGCIEEVMRRLREGGWGEEDVREMMMMNGRDETVKNTRGRGRVSGVSVKELLKSGWSIDDVVYSLGNSNGGEVEGGILDGEAWLEF